MIMFTLRVIIFLLSRSPECLLNLLLHYSCHPGNKKTPFTWRWRSHHLSARGNFLLQVTGSGLTKEITALLFQSVLVCHWSTVLLFYVAQIGLKTRSKATFCHEISDEFLCSWTLPSFFCCYHYYPTFTGAPMYRFTKQSVTCIFHLYSPLHD